MWSFFKQIYDTDAFVKLIWEYQPLLKFFRKLMFLSSDPLHYKTSASSFIKFEDIPSKPRAFDGIFFQYCIA